MYESLVLKWIQQTSFKGFYLSAKTSDQIRQQINLSTFLILWPITPVDSTSTSSGPILSSCNEISVSVTITILVSRTRQHKKHIPLQGHWHILWHLDSLHHPGTSMEHVLATKPNFNLRVTPHHDMLPLQHWPDQHLSGQLVPKKGFRTKPSVDNHAKF